MTRGLQIISVIAACLIGVVIGNAGLAAWPHLAGSGTASSDTRSIALLPAAPASPAGTSTDALIHQYQTAARQSPTAANFGNLALAYMQKERETADVTYYNLTEQAAARALRIDPQNHLALNELTWVAMGRHDFARAASMAQSAIKTDDGDAAAYGNLGDARANLGSYGAMVTAYQKMVNVQPGLASYNRASYARWLYGDVRGAVRYMLMAIHAGSTQPENVAWCQSQLGDDFFNAGFVLGAKQQYEAALHTFPHEAPAMAGLAQVEAALGHPKAAIRWYRRAIAIVPLPQYLTGLGDLYTSLGMRSLASQQYATIAFIEHIYTINHVRYGVEEAQFDADHNVHLAQALSIARREATTRHDLYTMDTLAWALYRNGQYSAAWKAERSALRLGTHYALYYFHAGMIEARLGNTVEAQSYLHNALMTNPNFSVLFAPVARQTLDRIDQKVAQG